MPGEDTRLQIIRVGYPRPAGKGAVRMQPGFFEIARAQRQLGQVQLRLDKAAVKT